MNKLLSFYLPKTSFEILKFFGLAATLVLALNFMPIESQNKSALSFFVLFFLFPLVSYFNSVMYLPSSLDWILLTPNKKSHIVMAHGLLNIFKIILMFILALVFEYIYDKKTFSKIFLESNFLEASGEFTRTSASDLVGWMTMIVILVVFIFGILPNYVQAIQQKQNYRVKKTKQEKVKSTLIILGLVFFGIFFISGTEENESYFPWFLSISAFFTFISLGAVYSTLTSIRYYFSKRKFHIFTIISFGMLVCFFHFYASNDIKSNNLHVKDKMNSLRFLGAYASNLEAIIEEELIGSGPMLAQLTGHNLSSFFDGKSRKSMAMRVTDAWVTVCSEKYDFTCRLAYYMASSLETKVIAFNQVRKACPNDLGSCFAIFEHKDVPSDERESAKTALIEGCKNKNKVDSNACFYFNKKMKKEKK